jgi:hypothetical protein
VEACCAPEHEARHPGLTVRRRFRSETSTNVGPATSKDDDYSLAARAWISCKAGVHVVELCYCTAIVILYVFNGAISVSQERR